MTTLQTHPNDASVYTYLASIEPAGRRADCQALLALMSEATGQPPRMWGSRIVGFDSYHYRYASGHEGDACCVGLAAGKQHLTLYIQAGFEAQAALLARLGKFKIGKSCLYIKTLADVDTAVLRSLVQQAVAEIKQRHP